ncbi:hypothetical protein M405DRAFT_139882 [Rhizopogon salebrosus TDB-379]|nr:hypothetical protein M405DRAFT_139882 [Rhizopogon salebrosus TDB-379]
MRSTVALKQRKRIRPVLKMLHELERAEEVDEDDDKGEKARRIESVRGRSWGEDEPAQCLSRPVGSVIPFVVICFQSGNIFHAVTVALLQTGSRTAYEGGGSEVLACRTIYRAWTTQCFKLSVEPGRYPSFASSTKSHKDCRTA